MTTNTIQSAQEQVNQRVNGRLLWLAPLAIALSTLANLALYALASTLIPEVGAWPGAGISQIIGATIVYLTVGTIAFAIIRRFSNHPARHYLIVATIGLLLSLALPISAGFGYAAPGAPPASLATVIILSLMHVISYAISVPLYIRRGLA